MRRSHQHTNSSDRDLAAPDVLYLSTPSSPVDASLRKDKNNLRFVNEAQVVNDFQREEADNQNFRVALISLSCGAGFVMHSQSFFFFQRVSK